MRIAIVTQYYRPEVVHIPYTLAEALARRGHSVRVVTGYPSYPHGRLFAGFRQRLRHVERLRGVTVRRVPLVVSHSTSAVGRLASYASFALSSLLAWRFVRSADVAHVYGAQPTAALGPVLWRRLSGIPFVLHNQDLWPESVTESSMVGGGVKRRLAEAILAPALRALYREASATVAIAPEMARILQRRGAPTDRLHTLLNWADERTLAATTTTAVDRARHGDGVTRFTYAGNLGDHQDLGTLLEAAAMLRDYPGIAIRIVGSGIAEPELRRRAVELGLTNVEFRGRVPMAELPGVYAESDFQIVSLTDRPIFAGTIPSKLQSGLMAGLPVIASTPGDVRDLVESNGLGLGSTPEAPSELAAALRCAAGFDEHERLAMSTRCREFYRREMAEAMQVARLVEIYRSVIAAEQSR